MSFENQKLIALNLSCEEKYRNEVSMRSYHSLKLQLLKQILLELKNGLRGGGFVEDFFFPRELSVF